jgi:hypothetical protein
MKNILSNLLKSPKTTLVGLAVAGLTYVQYIGYIDRETYESILGIGVTLGLLASKDADVTHSK